MDIARERLRSQRLSGAAQASAPEVVRWMGAVQAQDYGAARWAVAQRAGTLTAADVDRELAAGTILRTHVLRPTWHLVDPADIRWMLALTAPRIKAASAYWNRQSGLDEATFARANDAIATALAGGRQLTRPELADAVRQAGIDTADALRMGHLMFRAELDAVVCNGPLRGKQHTYALLEEWVPQARRLDRDAALAELASRYFTSHGPATVKDFAWWSGLSVTEATAGVRSAQPALEEAKAGGHTLWSSPRREDTTRRTVRRAHLLANFDEYTVGYADRGALLDDAHRHLGSPALLLGNIVVAGGRVVGTWKRVLSPSTVRLTLSLFRPLTEPESTAVQAAAVRYGRFLGRAADVERLQPFARG